MSEILLHVPLIIVIVPSVLALSCYLCVYVCVFRDKVSLYSSDCPGPPYVD